MSRGADEPAEVKPPDTERDPAGEDDAAGRVMAATGAMIQAQTQANEAALQLMLDDLRLLAAMIPGAASPKDGEDDDRFDDVPV
jgi:hypothetical protein